MDNRLKLLLPLLLLAAGLQAQVTTDSKDVQIAKQRLYIDTAYVTQITRVVNSSSTHRQLATAKAMWDAIAAVTFTLNRDTTLKGNGTAGNPLGLNSQGASTGQVLKYNGTRWAPGSDDGTNVAAGTGIVVSGTPPNITVSTAALGGDLSGTVPSATVTRIQNRTVVSTAPTNGQVYKWNSTSSQWEPSTDATATVTAGAGIFITGTAPNYTVTNTGDLSSTNEAQTISAGGTTSPTVSLNSVSGQGGGTITFAGAGGTTLSRTSNTITITGASGTVTSVDLALPSIFLVSGGPITGIGTITAALATQAANTFFAGPTTGAAATPGFRTLVGSDLPPLTSSMVTDFTEAAQDAVFPAVVAGSNITVSYNDAANTLTISGAASGGSGLTSLNGLTTGTQTFATGTSGTDISISSSTSTHTFNFPNASATARGPLTSADWTTFNSKVGGGGAARRVALWNTSNSINGDDGFFYDASNDRIGIRVEYPTSSLDILQPAVGSEVTKGITLSDPAATTSWKIVAGYPGSYDGSLQIRNTTNGLAMLLDIAGGVQFFKDLLVNENYSLRPVQHGNSFVRFIESAGVRRTELQGWQTLVIGASGHLSNWFTSTGTIGFGTSNPGAKLQINGLSSVSGSYSLIVTNASGVTSTAALVVQNNNTVGIGTNAPARLLHVEGNARITGSAGTPTSIFGRDGSGDLANVSLNATLALTSGTLGLAQQSATTGQALVWSGTAWAPATVSPTFSAQSANTFLAGPTTGAAATPTWRTMVTSDLPVIQPTNITGFDEAAQDATAAAFAAGTHTGISVTYNDAANSLALALTGDLYRADGSLTGNRTVTLGSNALVFVTNTSTSAGYTGLVSQTFNNSGQPNNYLTGRDHLGSDRMAIVGFGTDIGLRSNNGDVLFQSNSSGFKTLRWTGAGGLNFPASTIASPTSGTLWVNASNKLVVQEAASTRTLANLEDDLTGTTITVASGTWTVSGNQRTVLADCTGGSVTLTLGSSMIEGRDYYLATRNNGSGNTVTLSAASTFNLLVSGNLSYTTTQTAVAQTHYIARRMGTTIYIK